MSVSCTSSRDLDGLDFECSFNDESVTEGCEFWCLCCMPSSIVCWSRVIDVYCFCLHTGGQFPFFVSVAGASGSQTIVISATDPADGAGFTSTITITTTGKCIFTLAEPFLEFVPN